MKVFAALTALLFLWSAFFFLPVWLTGIFLCRQNAWWTETDKVQKYYEVSSTKIAELLIGKYQGYSTFLRTNIPLLYNEYRVNKYPFRLSALGALNYCVTAAIAVWYGAGVTAYFFFGWFDNPMIISGFILLMAHCVIFFIFYTWNKSRIKWEQYEVISKKELIAIKKADKYR